MEEEEKRKKEKTVNGQMTSADTKLGLLNSTPVLHIIGISRMTCELGNSVHVSA